MTSHQRSTPKIGWCFTVNNPTIATHEALQLLLTHNDCDYVCYQYEVGDNGTLHAQGWLHLKTKKRLVAVKRLPGLERAHLEGSRGTPRECFEYCSKEASRATLEQLQLHFVMWPAADNGQYAYGSLPVGAGARTDISSFCQALASGETFTTTALGSPEVFVRYSSGLLRWQALHEQELGKVPRTLVVEVLNGPTGSGKSWAARAENPEAYWLVAPNSKGGALWWDGYDGHKTLILDEFRGSWMSHERLLRILDGYPLQIQIKGGSRWALWTKVVITTTHPVALWYPTAETATGELTRRITNTRELLPRLADGGEGTGPTQARIPTPPLPGAFQHAEQQQWNVTRQVRPSLP